MGRLQPSISGEEDVEFRNAIAKRPDLHNLGNDAIAKILILEKIREINSS